MVTRWHLARAISSIIKFLITTKTATRYFASLKFWSRAFFGVSEKGNVLFFMLNSGAIGHWCAISLSLVAAGAATTI